MKENLKLFETGMSFSSFANILICSECHQSVKQLFQIQTSPTKNSLVCSTCLKQKEEELELSDP